MIPQYDLVVVGCGGIGSAALYHAAKRRLRVLGLDALSPPHSSGSSHGQSRIIRQAYFEHPDYVPLLLQAYELWHALEIECGIELLHPLGLLQVGPSDGVVVPGVMRSAVEHRLPVEHLAASEAKNRFPMFRLRPGEEAAYEPKAGVLWVEDCVRTHLEQAIQLGANAWLQCTLSSYASEADGILLMTSRGPVMAQRVLMACGAWTPQWLTQMPLTVLRKQLHWFGSDRALIKPTQGCPMFLMETEEGCYYGFPDLQARGMKVGEHSGGQLVTDPSDLDRRLNHEDLSRVERFLSDRILGDFAYRDYSVCMYTMTGDQHFVIDRDPIDPRLFWAGGFSGHGFKFAPVLGKLLVDWLADDAKDPRLDFLRLGRSA